MGVKIVVVIALVVIGCWNLGDSKRLQRIKLKSLSGQTLESVINEAYASVQANESIKANNRTVVQNLVYHPNTHYYAEVGFGTPAQKFRMLFDTGSSVTWIPSLRCNRSFGARKRKFDDSLSTTYSTTPTRLKVSYISGHIMTGQFVKDNVHIAGVSVVNQTFAEMENMENGIYHRAEFDGIIGLSFSEARLNYSKTLFDNMLDQRVVLDSLFSVHLRSNYGGESDGEIIFGGIDDQLYTGAIHYAPLTQSKKEWEINVDAVYLVSQSGSKSFVENRQVLLRACSFGCQATIDTGTALILGNKQDVDQINAKLGGFVSPIGVYALPHCRFDQYPDLVFSIAGRNFTLTPGQYIIQYNTISEDLHTICVSGLLPVEKSGSSKWVLGNIFLAHYYTVFDYGNDRIGFATSKE